MTMTVHECSSPGIPTVCWMTPSCGNYILAAMIYSLLAQCN